jgi:SAM-dependent methyltransferase
MKSPAAAAPRGSRKASPVKKPRGPAPVTAAAARRPVDLAAYRAASRCFEHGDGTPQAPLDLDMVEDANLSGCFHCPVDRCDCNAFDAMFSDALEEAQMARVTEVAGKNHLCAKSILPPFVTRVAAELRVTAHDTFYDLGSGNGSVLFQVAFMTGARCVGVELSPHNAELSRRVWHCLKPKLEAFRGGAPMPDVEIITGDLGDVVTAPDFANPAGRTAVWTANLLMPRSVTHFMSEAFRTMPRGCRFMCLDDLYPHGRPSCRTRDPEAFELFAMTDFIWPAMSVEWMRGGGGRFFMHERV